MKQIELNTIFTAKVAEYIGKGYIINVNTMGGSQGEIGKVDLRKGNEIIRVLMVSELNFDTYMDDIVIRVGRTTTDNSSIRIGTIWNHDLEHIEELRWCKVDNDWFVPMDEAKEISEKQHARYSNRRSSTATTITTVTNATEIAVRYLKRVTGKRITSKNLIKVTRATENGKSHYAISYHNKNYKLA